jgi:hypothetical protein
MRWVVVHKPVEIDGQTFLPRREGLSFIPKELESKMTANVRKSCVQVPDKFFPSEAPSGFTYKAEGV